MDQKTKAQKQKQYRDQQFKLRSDNKVDMIMSYRSNKHAARVVALLTETQLEAILDIINNADNA